MIKHLREKSVDTRWDDEQKKVYQALLDTYDENTAWNIVDDFEYRLWYGCHNMEDVAWEELDDIFDNIDNYYGFLKDFVDLEQFGYYLYTHWDFVECEDGMIQVY